MFVRMGRLVQQQKISKIQQAYLEYKAHAFTPGPMLLRHRALPQDKADIILDINVNKLKSLRSLVTEKLSKSLEVVDSRQYNVAEFDDICGPSRRYIEELLLPSVSDSRIALELLYRANLSCDLWEGVIIANISPAFHKLTQQQLMWKSTGNKHAPWVVDHHGEDIVAHIGCFPDEYLYHIVRGSEELGQLNEWPTLWSRINECGLCSSYRRLNVFEHLAAEQKQGDWVVSDSRLERKYLFSDSEKRAQGKKSAKGLLDSDRWEEN